MARRLAITKRVELAGLADGWDEQCYAIILKASIKEWNEFTSIDPTKMTGQQAQQFQSKFVKDHLVSGKVLVVDDETGEQTLDNLAKDDVDVFGEMSDKLLMEIAGLKFDPKDLSSIQKSIIEQTIANELNGSNDTPPESGDSTDKSSSEEALKASTKAS